MSKFQLDNGCFCLLKLSIDYCYIISGRYIETGLQRTNFKFTNPCGVFTLYVTR